MRYNRGIKGYGFPPRFGFYGGSRFTPLLLRRASYTPGLKTIYRDGREFIEQLPPSDVCRRPEKRPFDIPWARRLPHQEPPPSGTKIDFPNLTVQIPAGVDPGDATLAVGVYTNANLYTVPFGYRAEIKKLLIIPYDTDYTTLFVNILRNGIPIASIEGAGRYDGTGFVPPRQSYGYGILPTWPQDQFNMELRMPEGSVMGIQIANNTPLIREVSFGLFGWKYLIKCEDRLLGVE